MRWKVKLYKLRVCSCAYEMTKLQRGKKLNKKIRHFNCQTWCRYLCTAHEIRSGSEMQLFEYEFLIRSHLSSLHIDMFLSHTLSFDNFPRCNLHSLCMVKMDIERKVCELWMCVCVWQIYLIIHHSLWIYSVIRLGSSENWIQSLVSLLPNRIFSHLSFFIVFVAFFGSFFFIAIISLAVAALPSNGLRYLP